jgi:hypothetical protein
MGLSKKSEQSIRTRISAIYREKALIAMMHHVRGSVLMHQAQVLTRTEMDRVLFKPLMK